MGDPFNRKTLSMTTHKPTYGKGVDDHDWGCKHLEVTGYPELENIKICYATITDINKLAHELSNLVIDTSWMIRMDDGTQRSYRKTAADTAVALIEIFKKTSEVGTVGGDFGELMVSIGSTRALEIIFNHSKIPIAELWKPQTKQNEGFDFHTLYKNELINFGEAKFSSSKSPYSDAIKQSNDFINEEKHLRDRVHLINLVSENAIKNLDDDEFGIVAAFSVNAETPLTIFNNALKAAQEIYGDKKIKTVYLVGVSC